MLSLAEVAKKFNVERSTIYKAVNKGKLHRHENGKFKLEDVIEYFGEPKNHINDFILTDIIEKINLLISD